MKKMKQKINSKTVKIKFLSTRAKSIPDDSFARCLFNFLILNYFQKKISFSIKFAHYKFHGWWF